MHLPLIKFCKGVRILQQSNITEYVKTVCEQVRWKKAHDLISEEIKDHIVDQKNAFINSGLDDKTATEKAIIEMGDPVLIGTEFDRSYRPKVEWSIVILTCIMVFIGFLVRYFVIYNSAENINISISKDILSIIIGFAFMTTAYFLDFTIIGKHPKKIFFGLIVLVIVTFTNNNPYFSPTTFSFILLFFPTIFAGIIHKMRNKSYLGIIQMGIFFFIPAVICLNARTISSIIIYSISCLMLLTAAILNGWVNVKKSNALSLVYGVVALVSTISMLVIISTRSYMFHRLQGAFNPSLEPQTSGWLTIFVRNRISGAKLFGQGSLGEYAGVTLPSKHSDLLLTYLIHKVGWVSFIVVMMIVIIFIIRLFKLCKKQKSVLAKLVSTSILITFTMQVFVYVIYNLGFQLLSPLTLPFFSYGSASIVINMILIGILLSVFNTGDLYYDDKPKHALNKNKLFEYSEGKITIDLNTKLKKNLEVNNEQ